MATQDFSIGSTVKVGFMSLTVRAKVGAEYLLTNKDGNKLYCATPYNGCRAISIEDAEHLMFEQRIAEQNARADAWQVAQSAAKVNALFA